MSKYKFIFFYIFSSTVLGCNYQANAVNSIEEVQKLFPKSATEIEDHLEETKQMISKSIQCIVSIPNDQRTYQNTIKALDDMMERVRYNILEVLEFVSPEKDIRDAAHNAMVELQSLGVKEVFTNKNLYKAFRYYYDNQFKQEKQNLTREEIYYLDETVKDFEKRGLNLPDDELEKVRTLLKEIYELQLKFEQNINNDTSQIEVTLDELEGTSEQVISALDKSENGKYIVKTDYPTVFGILQHCDVQETRKKVQKMFLNRAYPKNYEILRQILIRKSQLAKLLGYKDYAHLEIEDTMAKSTERVQEFIDNLAKEAKLKSRKEIALFTKDLNDKSLFDQEGKVKPWNRDYILEKYKKTHLQVDEKEVAKYFPLENTIKELLDIYEQFLGIKFKEIQTDGFWHKDVKLVETYKNGKLLGYLLLDLHPRPNKYSHACNLEIIPAVKKDDEMCPAVSIVIANFTKSSSSSGEPALLTLKEVSTFFHEFGHALHSLLGRTKIASHSGLRVKSDFLELPSQMLEIWLNDREILKKISKHYKTGEPLPDNLVKKITKLEKLNSGISISRQLYLASESLKLFEANPHVNFDELTEKIHKDLLADIMWDPDDHFTASFEHLASDSYGPKYYGYLWSRVFAYDLFEKIKERGLLNSEIGQEYIDKVIGKGGSQDPNELLRDFLGREPNEKAFMAAMRFVTKSKKEASENN